MLFMGGILGRLFHEFAVTIAAAILVSGFVSLSLTPMLCSRFVRPPSHGDRNRLYNASEQFFNGLLHIYDLSLKQALKYHRTTMIIAGASSYSQDTCWLSFPRDSSPVRTGQLQERPRSTRHFFR
jgi:HAE1 family hydrophobic/amphiphilic exporter-1